MDPDQAAPIGAVRSGFTLFVEVASNDKSRRPNTSKIHYNHPFYLLQIFTFSNQVANDPHALIRR